jgi:hypothetical protein
LHYNLEVGNITCRLSAAALQSGNIETSAGRKIWIFREQLGIGNGKSVKFDPTGGQTEKYNIKKEKYLLAQALNASSLSYNEFSFSGSS